MHVHYALMSTISLLLITIIIIVMVVDMTPIS